VKLPLTTSRRRTFRCTEAVQVVGPVQRRHAVVTWPLADAGWLMSMVVAPRLEFASTPATEPIETICANALAAMRNAGKGRNRFIARSYARAGPPFVNWITVW